MIDRSARRRGALPRLRGRGEQGDIVRQAETLAALYIVIGFCGSTPWSNEYLCI
jgi:hypothetical protein